ncbi:MAG: phenylalanine--tRNA ligase subunit beta [Anaerovoracaceae bacterium]
MLVPIEWLKDYTKVNVTTEEFCDRMIMSGSNLETCTYFCEEMSGVVVGKIDKIEKHPDADKLVVCQLNVGKEEQVQIVTGAPNVFEGAVVPVALHKSKIPGPLHGQPKKEGGTKITKGKLRGVESFGMLCSASELGFEDKVVPVAHKDGIWILDDGLTLGQDFAKALELRQAVVDFEITPNRPDCLSMLGMARETAATFEERMEYPDTTCVKESSKEAKDFVNVEIMDKDLCNRYTARIVTDVKIEQSPWWLQKRLMYAGMRPINNIVDITNFVMLEYGQPLHAFDICQIADNKIIIEKANKGEKFTTLDQTERTLTDEMLLIKDGQKGIAIAGVMGGLNSEIQDNTTTILIESANFDADNVRATSKKLGLRTESSSRYEKGIDANLCEAAANRMCRLIEILGAGTVAKGMIDEYPNKSVAKEVDVRVDRVNSVLGIELSRDEMVGFFEKLEMTVAGEGNVMKVTSPTARLDLLTEIDFVEEVARLYGYDALPMTLPKGNCEATKPKSQMIQDMARNTMCAMGANEIQTYSFVSPGGVDKIMIDEDSWERAFVEITNPLGEENSVMRTVLTPSMLEVLGRNFSRNIDKVKAFEIGSTFMTNLVDSDKLPDEGQSLCIGLYGEDVDFFVLKGMVLELLKVLGITDVTFTSESEYKVYHPGRCARISKGDVELGIMGEVHPDVAKAFGIGTRAYCCEFFFDEIIDHGDIEKAYEPLPKYPSTSRDIALLVDEDVQVGEIEKIIREHGNPILEKVQLFDVYRGEQVAEGKKSAAFALIYRDKDKTLTDEDVAKVHNKVLEALKEKVNAVLREV